MNINAQELTLVRRNMKFGETPIQNPQTPAVAEPPVNKPETGLNALEAQAQSNIAFHGSSTVLNSLRQKMAPYIFAGLMGAATLATTTSCTDVQTEVTIDMQAFQAILASIDSKLQALLDEAKLSRETNEAILATQKENQKILKDMYVTEQLTLEEVRTLNENLTNGIETIVSSLKAQGATQEQILAAINAFRADSKAAADKLLSGQSTIIDYQAAIAQAVEDAKNILKDILTQVTGLRDDMNSNHEELMAAKEEEIEWLGKLYAQGENQTAILDSMKNNQKEMAANIQILTNNSNELLAIAKDDTKYNELMNKLDSLKPEEIDYKKFEQMFKLLNMNIQDAIKEFKADNKRGQQALINAINNFKNTYLKVEIAQSQQYSAIIDKLNFIIKYLPNLNQSDIEAAIKELTDAINNNTGAVEENTEVIGNGLNNIEGKLDTIISKMDTLIDNTAGLTDYFAAQKDNWINALKNLEKNNQMLDKILKEQKVTNEYLAGFKTEFAEMKANQKVANSYLNILVNKLGDVEKALEELDINVEVDGGMTREEFISAMEERDAKVAAEFKKFIEEYGFDKVPGDVQTIKEFLAQVKDAIQNQTDYSAQLDRIIALEKDILDFLNKADFSNPDYTAQLKEIIEAIKNWKCNCECGASSDKTDESIKDMEDMFS